MHATPRKPGYTLIRHRELSKTDCDPYYSNVLSKQAHVIIFLITPNNQ